MTIKRRLGRGQRPLRIAYGRIFHEGNAFSPLPTTREHFEDFHLLEGSALAEKCALAKSELEGFLPAAELSGFIQAARLASHVETIPLFSAMTVPGGRLTPETFTWLREELRAKLRDTGPLDGVYLALHGAMQVEQLDASPEGVLLADTRGLVGPDVALAASFDLHGNLVSSITEQLTVLTAYRTNPHRDLFQTGFRAGNRLIRALRGHARPVHAWRKLPMLLGGGTTVDLMMPMRKVFREMRAMERDPKVLGAHLFMVHPYSQAKDLGWAVHVTTDGEQAYADQLADELAERCFAVRDAPLPPMRAPHEALQDVAEKKKKPWSRAGTVSLVDVSDIVGAGAPGGNTRVLEAALEASADLRIYVPVHDPALVEQHRDTPLGTTVDVVVRGYPSDGTQPSVPIRGTLAARTENESGTVLRFDTNKVSVAVTERRPLTVSPRFWRELGLSPWQADAIVQKMLFHYRLFYVAVNRANIPVVTEGATNFDNIRNLELEHPMWPNQPVDEWRSFDRSQRGLA